MEEEGAGHGKLMAARGADLIGALPEDLLLQVIRRLGCAGAAARTSILSRPWRGLWRRLDDFTFHEIAPDSIRAALNSLVPRPDGQYFLLLDIRVPRIEVLTVDVMYLDPDEPWPLDAVDSTTVASISSLLDAVARLSPSELRFDARHKSKPTSMVKVEVPHLSRATSIELQGLDLCLTHPQSFPALEKLSLSCCRADLAPLVHHCSRLRVLRVVTAFLCDATISIRSTSLQELVVVVSDCTPTYLVDIEAPVLNNLMLSFAAVRELSVSIVAPMVENLSWRGTYPMEILGFGPWRLSQVKLETAQSGAVLGLWMDNSGGLRCNHAEFSLAQEIEKHLVKCFSVLHLHLSTKGHAFGAFVVYLLGIHRIRASTQRLKIGLQRFMVSAKCQENCPCDLPKNWRSQTISLINLEEVEIEGFEGEDHELDLLKLIFKCAPLLKRMTVTLSEEITTSKNECSKILDIFRAYPFVECNVYRTHGSAHGGESGVST